MRERISTHHVERDAEIFQMGFWDGRERRNGSTDDILRELMRMQIETAIQSRSKPTKLHGMIFSAHYPAVGRTKVIAPSDEEMKESLLRQILND